MVRDDIGKQDADTGIPVVVDVAIGVEDATEGVNADEVGDGAGDVGPHQVAYVVGLELMHQCVATVPHVFREGVRAAV